MDTLITLKIASEIEGNILQLLNANAANIVSNVSLDSPRAVGDAVQEFLAEHLMQCIPSEVLESFEKDFQRRSMEDMAFYDKNKNYYAVDVKTHNKGTLFNMPNLISVKRLATFYKNDTNFLYILFVEYKIENSGIHYLNCHFRPIEGFDWSCLTMGALGWGQIQIANSNNLQFCTPVRKNWMLRLCDVIDQFYETEMGKIRERKTWFESIRNFWKKR